VLPYIPLFRKKDEERKEERGIETEKELEKWREREAK